MSSTQSSGNTNTSTSNQQGGGVMDKIKDTMSSVGASLGLTKDSSKGVDDSHDKSHQSAGT